MPDEGGITFHGLFFVERLGVSSAFSGVVWGEGGEEFEDSETLVGCGEGDWVSGADTAAC